MAEASLMEKAFAGSVGVQGGSSLGSLGLNIANTVLNYNKFSYLKELNKKAEAFTGVPVNAYPAIALMERSGSSAVAGQDSRSLVSGNVTGAFTIPNMGYGMMHPGMFSSGQLSKQRSISAQTHSTRPLIENNIGTSIGTSTNTQPGREFSSQTYSNRPILNVGLSNQTSSAQTSAVPGREFSSQTFSRRPLLEPGNSNNLMSTQTSSKPGRDFASQINRKILMPNETPLDKAINPMSKTPGPQIATQTDKTSRTIATSAFFRDSATPLINTIGSQASYNNSASNAFGPSSSKVMFGNSSNFIRSTKL